MNSLSSDYAAGLLNFHEPPCISLYQSTHRHHPDKLQDPIRFRNHIKSIEESLRQKYSKREIQPLMEPFQALADDRDLWNHTLNGLIVFGASGFFRNYLVQRQIPGVVIVADSFHIKPLMRIVQSADRYQLLALNRREIKLFEGNRDSIDEIEPAEGVPRTISAALGEELTERPALTSFSPGAGAPAIRHGYGSKQDQLDIDAERFFRAVDRAVLEHHSRPSGLPLILAALPENHNLFCRISQNPFLLADAIDTYPDALSTDALRERAWRVVEPQYLARLTVLVDEFGAARSKGLGSDDLASVAKAAADGRVATILVDADRHIPGRIDEASGRIEYGDLAHPEVDDLLDDVGELVARRGGEIIIVPPERMPTQAGVAAIYRY